MVNTPEELGAWLRLVLTPGVGTESARRLLAAFGEPEAIFSQTETALCQVVSPKQAQALCRMPDGCADLTQDTLEWLQAGTGPSRCVLTLGDADYPAPLLDIPDPPLMLYAMGQTAHLPRLRQPGYSDPGAGHRANRRVTHSTLSRCAPPRHPKPGAARGRTSAHRPH